MSIDLMLFWDGTRFGSWRKLDMWVYQEKKIVQKTYPGSESNLIWDFLSALWFHSSYYLYIWMKSPLMLKKTPNIQMNESLI